MADVSIGAATSSAAAGFGTVDVLPLEYPFFRFYCLLG